MKRSAALILIAVLLVLTAACGKANTNNGTNSSSGALTANLKLGKSAEYKTVCKSDASKTTTGTLKITEVKHYKNGEDLPDLRLEALEGYEWTEVRAETVFDDENAAEYGVDRASCVSDYYDLKLFESSLKVQGDFTSFAIRAKDTGVVMDKCLFVKTVDNQGWTAEGKNICSYTWYFCVPEKYDGIVIVFMNAGTKWPEGKYIYEVLDADALVYRVTD